MAKLYAEVKYHTRQKHAFLEEYLRVWLERVGKNNGPNSPSLALFDLFAGSGWCSNRDRNEKWPGTATLLARCLGQYPSRHPTVLFLNTFHTKKTELDAQENSLKETLTETTFPPKAKVTLETKPFTDALAIARKAFNPNFPSLWVLDPYAAQDLPWTAVEEIANLRGPDHDRRPELFINLMTFDLLENMKPNPHVVSTALGMPESEWKPLVDRMAAEDSNKRNAFVEIYAQRLTALYGRPPHFIEVEGVHGNIVYVLFFCSTHDAGFHMMRTESLPKFATWHEREWKPAAKAIVATKKVDRKAAESGQKQTKLDFGKA